MEIPDEPAREPSLLLQGPDGKWYSIDAESIDLASPSPTGLGYRVEGTAVDEISTFTRGRGRMAVDPKTGTFEWSAKESNPLEDILEMKRKVEESRVPPIHGVPDPSWPEAVKRAFEESKRKLEVLKPPPKIPFDLDDEEKERIFREARAPKVMPFSGPDFPGPRFGREEEYIRVPVEVMGALLDSLGGSFTVTVEELQQIAWNHPNRHSRNIEIVRMVDERLGMMYKLIARDYK